MLFDLTSAELIARIIVLVVAFTIHEFAHAYTADRFGDTTPRLQGRLTLNPLAHLDPLGSLLLLVTGFGWAKPVQINPYALERRNRAAPMLVALAGPASNLLLAVLASLPVRLGLVTFTFATGRLFPTASQLINDFVQINLLLMLFNLIPISPLDGEKVLTYFLPPSGRNFMDQIRPYGPLLLMLVIFVLPSLGFNVLQAIIVRPMVLLYSFLLG
jgi:Zn-dependent protease